MSYQHIHEIQHITFVTEDHALVKFRSGKIVIFKKDGTIEEFEVEMGRNPQIIGETSLNQGVKFVALESK